MDKHMAKEVFKCLQANMDSFTDFTVNVGDFQFDCHKFILSSCSGFFNALLRTDMKEKSESSCTLVGISPDIFDLILDVLYKGKKVLNEENMLAMWHASNQLQIEFLISACEKFVKNNTTLENFCDVYQAAKLLDSAVVIAKVKELLTENFSEIAESNDLTQLTYDDFSDLLENILFFNADLVVDLVLKWTCSDDSFLTPVPYNSNGKTSTFLTETDSARCRKIVTSTNDNKNTTLRRSYLGQLLAIIPLKNTSNACLTSLMNNRFVMENIDAITIVNKLAASRVGSPENENSTHHLTPSSTKTNGFGLACLKLDSDVLADTPYFLLGVLVAVVMFLMYTHVI
ncbi:kelch-like protein 41 [Physella acuta]|uniref:kelch-like protein 41 n=1 Tax=Physella acuta TaxID=109671 RepID=UPI0027DD1B5A|nr:kelch-like protein 41 [Physella acuta]XP_059157811.1 kelch-like protein 41 [Physella acuta]